MAGNPVFAGVSGFCVNGYPRNTWSNIYANTQVSWFQTGTQTGTQIMLTCVQRRQTQIKEFTGKVWRNLRTSSQIRRMRYIRLSDDWPEIQDELIDCMDRFIDSLGQHLQGP